VDETFSRLLFGGGLTDVRKKAGAYMQSLIEEMNSAATSDERKGLLGGMLSDAQRDLGTVESFAAALEKSGMAASNFGSAADEAQRALAYLIGSQNDLLTTAARPGDAEVIFSKMLFGVDVAELKTRLTEEIDSVKQMLTERQKDGGDVTMLEQLLGDKQRTLQDLEFYLGVTARAKEGLTAFGDSFRLALGGGDDLIGKDVATALDSISASAIAMGEALSKADATGYGVFTAAMPAMRGFFHEFVKDRKARAGIEAAMNAAAAWAAWPNVPLMLSHGTAAVMYGLVAGGLGVRLPTMASSARKNDAGGGGGGPIHLHYYGDPVSTEADRGVLVDRLVAESRAEGRFA